MSHMIDQSTGRDAIAFVGQTPWHGLGKQLTSGADIETWTRESGLDYRVERAVVQYRDESLGADGVRQFPARDVLFRSDTRQPLSVVSNYYNVVQPAEILDFFSELAGRNGFTLETAGALDDGKRVWALARVNEGAPILDADVIRPYVLLATSYDSSLSTTAKFTSIRVVCHNTLAVSTGYGGEGRSEKDSAGSCIRIPHSAKFDAKDVRLDLGIVFDEWERFLVTIRRLARTAVDDTFAREFLKQLLPAPTSAIAGKVARPVEETKAFKSIIGLFEGCAIGSDLPEAKGAAYGLLNAVTEYVDHQRGGDLTRLSSAWFGSGEGLKNEAFALLEKIAA